MYYEGCCVAYYNSDALERCGVYISEKRYAKHHTQMCQVQIRVKHQM